MKFGTLIFAAFLVLGVHATRVDAVTLHAMMILATDDSAPLDRRLDRIVPQLRHIFHFQNYRFMSEGEVVINPPGEITLDLGEGYRLIINTSESKGRLRAAVRWLRGEEPLLNTTIGIHRGSPVILGGVPHQGGTLIVTLTAN